MDSSFEDLEVLSATPPPPPSSSSSHKRSPFYHSRISKEESKVEIKSKDKENDTSITEMFGGGKGVPTTIIKGKGMGEGEGQGPSKRSAAEADLKAFGEKKKSRTFSSGADSSLEHHEEVLLGQIRSDMEKFMVKRKQDVKDKIVNNFKEVKAPEKFYQLQKAQSEEWMYGCKKFEDCIAKCEEQLEQQQARQEKNFTAFLNMAGSLERHSKNLTQDIVQFRDGIASVAKGMGDALEEVQTELQKCDMKTANAVVEGLKQCEKTCDKEFDKSNKDLAAALVEIVPLIYDALK